MPAPATPLRAARHAPQRSRRTLWIAAVLAVAAALIALVVATRSPPPEKTELRLRVLPRDGTAAVTETDTRNAVAEVDITIGELGIERREVSPLGIGVIRVVLPDNVRARMPEIRKRLADPRLRLSLE